MKKFDRKPEGEPDALQCPTAAQREREPETHEYPEALRDAKAYKPCKVFEGHAGGQGFKGPFLSAF